MPVAIVGAGVAAAGSVAGGIMSANAQKSAAATNAGAVNNALDWSKQVYGTEQGQLNPYINTGTNALYSLSSLYGLGNGPGGQGGGAAQAYQNYTNTPAYQFPLAQGELAANRGLAAQGLSGSGAQAKALTQYGQGYASTNFNSYISQLAGLAGLGQSSATALGNTGVGVGTQNLQGSENVGGTNAASIIGQNNSLTQGIGQAIGALGNPNSNPSGSAFGPTSAVGQGVNYLSSLFNPPPSASSFGGGAP